MDFRTKASFASYNIKTDFVQPWWRMFTWWYALSLYIQQITFCLSLKHEDSVTLNQNMALYAQDSLQSKVQLVLRCSNPFKPSLFCLDFKTSNIVPHWTGIWFPTCQS